MNSAQLRVEPDSSHTGWMLSDDAGKRPGTVTAKADAALMAQQKAATLQASGTPAHGVVYGDDGALDADLSYGG